MRKSSADIRVRYAGTDKMGRVYYARYFEWFELGRSQYMRDAGLPYPEVEAGGVYLPVVEAHCRYHGAPEFDSVVLVETTLDQPVRARAVFRYTVTSRDDGALLAEGWTSHPFLNHRHRPARPPEWVRRKLEEDLEAVPGE